MRATKISWCGRSGYYRTDASYVSADLLALPITGVDRNPIEVAADPGFEEGFGAFSPDGRQVVYDTDQPDGRTFNVFNHNYDVSSDGRFLVPTIQ